MNVFEITIPLHNTCKFLGLATYYIDKTGIPKISIWQITQAATFTLATLILSYFYFQTFFQIPEFAKASTIKFLTEFRIFGNIAVMILVFSFSLGNSRKMIGEMQKIVEIDEKLSELGQRNALIRSNQDTKRGLIAFLIILNLIVTVLGELSPVIGAIQNGFMLYFLFVYPRLIICSVNISFYLYMILLEKRFGIINTIMKKLIEDSHKSKKYPNEPDFCTKIRNLVSLHKTLVKISQAVNQLFGVQTLLCITMNFVLLIGDLHTTMFVIFFNLFGKHYELVFGMLKSCAIYLFDLYYLAKRTTDLCRQVSVLNLAPKPLP